MILIAYFLDLNIKHKTACSTCTWYFTEHYRNRY